MACTKGKQCMWLAEWLAILQAAIDSGGSSLIIHGREGMRQLILKAWHR